LGTICNAWWRGTMDWSEWSRPLSRVLVFLTTLLLLVMPVTEYLCNWDRFLRGGPDVEFSLLAGLLFWAMVVLSMNGTMLQPRMLQPQLLGPAVMQPASGIRAAWPGVRSGSGGALDRTVSGRSRSRWLDELSSLDSGIGTRAPVPMRI
jgi:hypothetical protein